MISKKNAFSLLIATTLLCACGEDKKEEAAAPAKLPEVPVIEVTERDVPIIYEFTGQTKGSVDAEVRARVDGIINSINFEEGKPVKEGDLLYTIDPAPFLAKVAESKGKVAEADARAVKAVADLKRIKPLADMNAVSKRDLDAAVAQDQSAKAGLEAARASLTSSEIELGYTKVTAPVSGFIGLTKAKVGEYVGKAPNAVVLNTVSQIDPFKVRVSITEQDYLYFSRLKQEAVDAGEQPAGRSNIELYLVDGSLYPERGKVASIDSQVDPTTGTLAVEIAFDNPKQLIRPGQFARIKVAAENKKNALVVPKRAIEEMQGTYRVYVIGSDGAVDVRPVKLGQQNKGMQIINEGLKSGELVAVEGLQRLRPGVRVAPIKKQITEDGA